jgi:hypothetical protein
LNGDGVGDLVVHSLAGRRISSKQSTYEVHFGAPALDGGTAFALDVIVGVPGPDLFARRGQDVPVVVPNDEEYTWLVDLNQDGKQDSSCITRSLYEMPTVPRYGHREPSRIA